MILSRLSEIFNDTKRRVVSLRQLSFLSEKQTCHCRLVAVILKKAARGAYVKACRVVTTGRSIESIVTDRKKLLLLSTPSCHDNNVMSVVMVVIT